MIPTTDGAVKLNGTASGGGLIHNGQGAWVVGFTKIPRDMSAMEEELWALRVSLQIAA